jgi:hypothetical protein
MRKNTKELLGLIAEGLIDREEIVIDLLNYLSDAEVGEFMEKYGYAEIFEEEED